MEDVKRIHKEYCKCFNTTLDLSLDGVQESKSSSLSADVFSVSFKNCRTVYPVRIIRPINKFKVDEQVQIKAVVDDINNNNCCIHCAVFDNPKRSDVRCALSHGASYACEYCEAKAQYISENGKKGHLAWPFSTSNGAPRTLENIVEITEKLANGENLSRDEAKGFWGTSILLHQENFHFIVDIPAEYMHSSCIGVVKRLIELTFNVGESRKRNTKRKLSDAASYNVLILVILVPREFSRRLRNLDLGVMKAQEFRNIILFFFTLVVECIPDEFKQEKKNWLQLAFIMRACVLTNKEFNLMPHNVIRNLGISFYKNYESVYGQKNCTYSTHLVGSHIVDIRGDEPLTSRSAFKYENFYSELRNLFQPGTISPSKQILQNCYLKRQLENHNCEKSIFYDVQKNGREDNSLVYYIDEQNEYRFFKIIKVNTNGTVTCYPQGRHIFKCDIVKDLKWEQVGVFEVGPYLEEEIILPTSKLEGKIIKVNNLFITCPNNVLREQ